MFHTHLFEGNGPYLTALSAEWAPHYPCDVCCVLYLLNIAVVIIIIQPSYGHYKRFGCVDASLQRKQTRSVIQEMVIQWSNLIKR